MSVASSARRNRSRLTSRALCLTLLLSPLQIVLAGDPADVAATRFTVADIRLDGLRRIGAGTVFTYLPIERGDTVDSGRVAEAMRALYKTGFFEDVKIDREGDILVVTLTERPAINSLTLSGNKDLKTEDLTRNLKDIGIAEGETFDRLALDRVTQELKRAYNNRGKYNVTIEPKVSRLDRNRVDITIEVDEGKAARIRHINIVGNDRFDEEQIRERWESSESNWLSWYRRDDQYSREKLSGDLEKLNEYYLDRGYVDFAVDSTQVAISPDKKDMYITAGVTEGEVYTISDVKISGDTVLSKEEIERYLVVKEGQTFSRALLEFSSDAIVATLGNIGYADAKVDPLPDIDRGKREVSVDMRVVPGPRVSVRRILFRGNTRTTDEVLRREMRQFEGAWYSQAAIDRSKTRLQRLGFFETGSVEIQTEPVPDRPDQVDLIVAVRETSSGQFQAGLGFSQDSGLNITFQISQRNLFGSGRGIDLNISRSDTTRAYGFSISEPYFDDAGLGLQYGLSSTTTRLSDDDDSSYDSDQQRASLALVLPLSEYESLRVESAWERQTLYLYDGYYPPSWIDYIDALGDNRIDTLRLRSGWSADTRNDFLMPTRGSSHSLSLDVSLPGSTAQYFKIDYRYDRYWPIGPVNLLTRAEFGYGDGYGGTISRTIETADGSDPGTEPDLRTVVAEGLPFYQTFYAGGSRSLRGFRDNSLGPCEYVLYYNDCRPTGGSLKTLGGLELTIPGLMKDAGPGTRLALFFDAGNVFAGFDGFDASGLRASVGASLLWRSPMGPITISYGIPLREREGDDVERLQFGFGGQF